jgi:predicted nuclease of predicted toxin-antitoxin system
LKLLADLHISPKTVQALRKSGYTISRVTDHLPSTSTDRQIIELAERLQPSIVTQDLDFSRLIAKSGKTFPSILSLRLGNVSHQHVTDILMRLLPAIEKDLEEGAVVSVDEVGMRIRMLPIK